MPTKSKIQDQTFLFTGTLTEFTRDEAEALVEANGGNVLSGVSAKLNYLIVGEDAGSKLEKAKKLGTVKIITEKEFLKMVPKSKSDSAKSDAKSTVEAQEEQGKNEILLDLKFADLKKFLKKYVAKSVTDKIVMVSDTINCFEDISSDDQSYFYFAESTGKLIMNYLVQDNYNENAFKFGLDFFNEISKHSKGDFKMVYLDHSLWQLSYCLYTKGEVQFMEDSVSDWEDPMYFDDIPYFVKLAKSRGMKKKKDEYGDKVWDSEEVYDLIYEFRDSLASGCEYENIAPDWYSSYKSIPN
jgi:hypothetical protein